MGMKVRITIGAIMAALFALALLGGSNVTDAVHGVGTLSLIAAAYLLPTIIAHNRQHNNKLAITVLNVLLGWTLLGWVVAAVWACTKDVQPSTPLSHEPPQPRQAFFRSAAQEARKASQ